MPFHRQRMGLRPVNANKNIVDAQGTLIADTAPSGQLLRTLVEGVDNPSVDANTEQVQAGSKVTSLFLSLFFSTKGNASATVPEVVDWYIIYDVAGRMSAGGTFGNGSAVLPIASTAGESLNRNQILHMEKGLVGDAADGSKMVFQGVIRIPRGKQRIGIGTKVQLVAQKQATDKFFCIKCIYKYYQ